MTQLEYVIWQFVEANPRCTAEDIVSSFAKAPENGQLENVLSALEFQNLIRKVCIQADTFDKPLYTYYYSAALQA
ncbi:MAG: hypothetical protein KC422_04680 [Trueperaceae bacterium]|nr:hypothetical protein [Trueperaceae bacterium]